MVFDGRSYAGAAFIPPIRAHPAAPPVGDILGQSLAGAYFVSQHHACLIGTQTYPHRRRFSAQRSSFSSSSAVRLAEFQEAYLPQHATHLWAEALFAVSPTSNNATVHHQVAAFDGSSTDTGADAAEVVDEDSLLGTWAGYDVHRAFCSVALSNVTVPDTAEVYVQGYAEDSGSSGVDYFPIAYTVWRVTVP